MMKLTKKIALEVAINAIENSTLPSWSFTEGEETLSISKAETIEKLQKMIEQLDAKAAAPKKQTARQTENAACADELYRVLCGQTEGRTITELMELGAFPDGATNQRATAIMGVLVDDGRATREVIKRKAYFTAVPEKVEG